MLVNQNLIEKNGTVWQFFDASHVQRRHSQQQNILNFKPGPTAFATSRIMDSNSLASFYVLFDGTMLKNIRKCTVAEAHSIFDLRINLGVSNIQQNSFKTQTQRSSVLLAFQCEK